MRILPQLKKCLIALKRQQQTWVTSLIQYPQCFWEANHFEVSTTGHSQMPVLGLRQFWLRLRVNCGRCETGLSSSILSVMMLVLQGWVGQRPGWAYCCWQTVTICVHQKRRWGATRITHCWNVLRAMQPARRLLAVGTWSWQGMRIPPLHLLTFLLAWPKQAKIGFHDRPIICVLGLQGMSSSVCFMGKEPLKSLTASPIFLCIWTMPPQQFN